MKRIILIIALFVGCILCLAEPEKITPFFAWTGDTFLAAPDSINCRLWGVDTPELNQSRRNRARNRANYGISV